MGYSNTKKSLPKPSHVGRLGRSSSAPVPDNNGNALLEAIRTYQKDPQNQIALQLIFDIIDIRKIARIAASRARTSVSSGMMNYDDCLSAAIEGIEKALKTPIDEDDNYRGFLITSAYHKISDMFDHVSRRAAFSLDRHNFDPNAPYGMLNILSVTTSNLPPEEVNLNKVWEIIATTLGRDSEKYQLFKMCMCPPVDRKPPTYEEIGKVFGIPAGTVKSRIFAIKKELLENPQVIDDLKEVSHAIIEARNDEPQTQRFSFTHIGRSGKYRD